VPSDGRKAAAVGARLFLEYLGYIVAQEKPGLSVGHGMVNDQHEQKKSDIDDGST